MALITYKFYKENKSLRKARLTGWRRNMFPPDSMVYTELDIECTYSMNTSDYLSKNRMSDKDVRLGGHITRSDETDTTLT